MYPYKTTIVVFWGSTDDDLDRSLSHCYHMLSKNTWWFSSIGFLQIWKIHLIVLKIVWICETLSSKWCWWFWKKSFVRSSIKFSICQELLWCTSKMVGSKNQPRIGSDFHANHQRTLLTSKNTMWKLASQRKTHTKLSISRMAG
jgi:hypothetical protein